MSLAKAKKIVSCTIFVFLWSESHTVLLVIRATRYGKLETETENSKHRRHGFFNLDDLCQVVCYIDESWGASPLRQNCFILIQFSGKVGQIVNCPTPLGVGTPLGNPGSATVFDSEKMKTENFRSRFHVSYAFDDLFEIQKEMRFWAKA